jgi:hypothetical protein
MTCQLVLNWKSFAIIGASVIGTILAKKVNPEQAANVLNRLFDTSKAVITGNSED